jgi:predicted ribosome quality control (RQC) complex YloA/Tae2 family protein
LPQDVTEPEAKEALGPTVNEACQEIEQRKAEEQRKTRKASLVQEGVNEVSSYLLELRRADEISADDYRIALFDTALSEAVRRNLDADLTGDETIREVREVVHSLIDGELR